MIKPFIPRDAYLRKVLPFVRKDLIKVITGQRRSGKSYILFQIMDHIRRMESSAQILYINMELDEFASIRDHEQLLKFIYSNTDTGKGRVYLFIDEIQDIPGFEKGLRSLAAKGGYDLYITGSNASMLAGDLSGQLSGRYVEIRMHSLSFQEFAGFHQLAADEETLQLYIRYGGLPYLKNLQLTDDIAFEYIQSVYNTIILKDVVARYGIRNLHLLDNLNRYLAQHTGSLVSAKRISDFLKSQQLRYSPRVILDYLSHLCEAYFIHKVRRADLIGRKIFEINEKYYFEDLGLRHLLNRFTLADSGKVLENLVFSHMVYCGYRVHTGQIGNREIDFWCERHDRTMYIQAAYLIADESTREREFGNLLGIPDNFPKYVVSMDRPKGAAFKGIEHINILDFLLEEW